MKIFSVLFNTKGQKASDKEAKDQSRSNRDQQELLSKLGREQFKKLVDKGLGVPVALL